MKPYLRILNQNFAAGQNFARLPLAGNFLRVLAAPAPFTFTLGDESTVDLVPGMGVFLSEEQAFQVLRINRADATSAAVLQIAVGFQPADKPLVLTDNRAVADITNRVTIEDARKINLGSVIALPPPVHGRFLPNYSAKAPFIGDALYAADTTLGPVIKGGVPAGLNLLAPADNNVSKRILRLTAGATANIGLAADKMGNPGQSLTLTTASPELILPGGDALFGTSTEDCSLTIHETLETATPSAPVSLIPSSVAAPGVTIDVPRTLWASSSWNIEFGSVVIKNDFSNPIGADIGLKTSPAFGKVTSSLPGVSGLNSFAVAGVTSAEVPTVVPAYGESANKSYFYLYLRTESNQGTRYVTFDTGQRFEIPRNLSGSATNGTAFKSQTSGSWWWPGVFRAVIPWDGSPMYWEQNQWSGVGSWSRNP